MVELLYPRCLSLRAFFCLLGLVEVQLNVVLPPRRDITFDKDCRNRALRFTQSAIDALVGVNDDHVVDIINAAYRAHIHTGLVLNANTGFGYYVGHSTTIVRETRPRFPLGGLMRAQE